LGAKMKQIVMAAIVLLIQISVFPLIFTGVAAITGHTDILHFTGLSSIALLIPLTSLVFMVFNSGWMALSAVRGKGGSVSIAQGIAAPIILFIGLLMIPIIMTGLHVLLTTDNGTYTGFTAIVQIVPLPLLVALAFGSGYMA
jgi:hypothetical protein